LASSIAALEISLALRLLDSSNLGILLPASAFTQSERRAHIFDFPIYYRDARGRKRYVGVRARHEKLGDDVIPR
jgi:hypothetical protein